MVGAGGALLNIGMISSHNFISDLVIYQDEHF